VWSVVVQASVRYGFCVVPIDSRLQELWLVTSCRSRCAVVKIVDDTASI
jgi:hypothetical protein